MRRGLVLALGLSGCSPDAGTTPPEGAAPLAAVSWLSGAWRATADDNVVQETWSPARGDVMLGVSRTRSDEGQEAIEMLRLEVRGERLAYVAAPPGQAVATFLSSSLGAQGFTVEDPAHDFPKRIAYRREGDQLTAQISGSADQPTIGWSFAREAPADSFPIKEAPATVSFDPPTQSIVVEIPGSYCAKLVCAVMPAPAGPTLQVAVLDTTLDCSGPASGHCGKPSDVDTVHVGGASVDLTSRTSESPWSGTVEFLYRLD